ncbi:MAG: MBL fold metallo-hydrolase [Acidobacteria bacterium]|nr:MBL fold metallo-hydrolase [Acidobacteriota bacterium]
MKTIKPFLLLFVLGIFPAAAPAQVGKVQEIAPGVYFRQGDLEHKGHCNNAWVIFEDYVVVIDANFPSGAEEVLPEIRRTTSKPIRFVFDTHHHGDHAYGNMIWVLSGAVPVAQENVREEIKRYEPRRWEEVAHEREDVKKLGPHGFKAPTLLFPDRMIFDDGRRRLELLYFGVAHTRGDGFGHMPNERILFTGDACLNGPYNYMGDGDSESWIKVLETAEKLNFDIILPGHGPVARDGKRILAGQKQFFIQLRKQVKDLIEAKKSLDEIRSAVRLPDAVRNWVGKELPSQIEQVYKEMTGAIPRAGAR